MIHHRGAKLWHLKSTGNLEKCGEKELVCERGAGSGVVDTRMWVYTQIHTQSTLIFWRTGHPNCNRPSSWPLPLMILTVRWESSSSSSVRKKQEINPVQSKAVSAFQHALRFELRDTWNLIIPSQSFRLIMNLLSIGFKEKRVPYVPNKHPAFSVINDWYLFNNVSQFNGSKYSWHLTTKSSNI